jgi:MEMO1 family protein
MSEVRDADPGYLACSPGDGLPAEPGAAGSGVDLENATMKTRQAIAAGRFYPGEPAELRKLVESLLSQVQAPAARVPKALIAPHAGYIYSGPIAASAYARLLPARDIIRRVVLLGPSHYAAFNGLAASSADTFATPLGLVQVDAKAVGQVLALPEVSLLDVAHTREHSLEVQLPFLQTVLKDFALVPLAAGEVSAEQISRVLEVLWGGPETCFVISSDLSHYLDSTAARRVDQSTADAIESLRPAGVGEAQACGRLPILGLLDLAHKHHLRPQTVDLRNSGDTAGPRERVVGYGAFVFVEG